MIADPVRPTEQFGDPLSHWPSPRSPLLAVSPRKSKIKKDYLFRAQV